MKLEIENLKPYEKNARKHQKEDVETIKASIKEFGMCDPIGIWGEKNIIVEGHGRLMALKETAIEQGWSKHKLKSIRGQILKKERENGETCKGNPAKRV